LRQWPPPPLLRLRRWDSPQCPHCQTLLLQQVKQHLQQQQQYLARECPWPAAAAGEQAAKAAAL
jgi:hypothetical protein